MNPILEDLERQHRAAEHLLADLSAAVRRLRSEGSGGPGVLADLARCRTLIQNEIDAHFREEEQALFPVLGRRIGTEDGPIAVLMEEHSVFRRLQLDYERALGALEAGESGEWPERLAGAADAIHGLLPPHIEKEEQVLFPMAEAVLEDGEWDEVRALCRCAPAAPLRQAVRPSWPWRSRRTFSPAVLAGDLLFISGIDARDDQTGQLTASTMAEQCEVIYRKLGRVLASVGLGFESVVKTTDYIVDTEGYAGTAEIRRRYLGPDFPAASGVVVKELLGRGALIEIEAVAVR